MRSIVILHGCVADWQPSSQAMRMYAPEDRLRRHLLERNAPYVDPDEDDAGDVLTVDDSTRGGARSCLLARELGHAVTLFVNPSQIISGRDYWFSRFDALVDARQATAAAFGGASYDLGSRQGLHDFRWAVRTPLVTSSEDAAHRLLDDVAVLLQAEAARVPDHARSIDRDDLIALQAAGVRIESHGWDHQCISSLSPDEQIAQLADTRDWLHAMTGRAPRDYAVPFGQARLDARARREVPGLVYLVDRTLPPDAAEPGYLYRRNMTPSLQQANA